MTIAPSAQVHPSAVIEPGATLGAGVRVGPFALVGAEVVLHEGVEVKSHAVVTGRTEVGAQSVIFSFAVVGEVPQDLKYRGEPTRLVVGRRNRIREGATLNIGTAGGGGITRTGDDCLFMTGAHVGHDAQVGDRVVMANQSALAGHCVVGDDVIIGGLCGIHQFVRIGTGAIIGAVTMVTHDVIPYALVHGPQGELAGMNLVGLKRRGIGRDSRARILAAYERLRRRGDVPFHDEARRIAQDSDDALVQEIAAFILADSRRSFLTPK